MTDDEEAEDHSAEMREVRNVVARTLPETGKKLDQSIADHEVFRLDRDGGEEKEKLGVREKHPEREQHSEYGARCADHGADMIEEQLHDSFRWRTTFHRKHFDRSVRAAHIVG